MQNMKKQIRNKITCDYAIIGSGNIALRHVENIKLHSTMETQSKEGMMTMEQHLLHLYQHNVITKESAIAYTNEASLLERLG